MLLLWGIILRIQNLILFSAQVLAETILKRYVF